MSGATRVGLCAVLGGLWVPQGVGAPDAGLIAKSWQLDFEFEDPQRITLTLPGDSHPSTYWYMVYKVTNNTGREVEFYPSFRLVTDTLKVVVGGEDISPTVYDAIQARHSREYRFFRSPNKVLGTLLQGEENARVSAVAFRMFDKEASSFAVYVAGLSGDVERLINPALDPAGDRSGANRQFFLLRRTLMVKYDLPGDPITRAQATPVRRGREWVMR